MGLYDIGCCAGDDERIDGEEAESTDDAISAQIRMLRIAAASRRMEGNSTLAQSFDDRADKLEQLLSKSKPQATKNKPKKKPTQRKKTATASASPSAMSSPQQLPTESDDDSSGKGWVGFAALLTALGVGAYAMKKSRVRSL